VQDAVNHSRQTAVCLVVSAANRTPCQADFQNLNFNFAIGKGGVFLLKRGVLADKAEQGFGGGGVVASVRIEVIVLAELFVFTGKADELVGISSNIVNGDIIKGVYGLKPFAVKIENFFVKCAIVGESTFDIEKAEKSAHILGDISPLFKADFLCPHSVDINGALFCIVSGGKQFRIVPNLLNAKLGFVQDFCRFGVIEDKTDIVAKRLF
jgi:hypothetical protein